MISGKRKYSVIRSHGLSLHLLPYKELLALVEYEDLEQLLWWLSGTEYSRFFREKEDLLNNVEIERKINRLLYERLSFILSLLDKKMLGLIQAYLSKYDLEKLRRAIYAKTHHKEITSEDFFPGEFFPGISQLFEVLEGRAPPPYPGLKPIIDAIEEWSKSGEDIVSLDMLLESSYAKILTERMKTRFLDKRVKEIFYDYLRGRILIAGLRAIYCDKTDKISVLRRFIESQAYEILSTAKDLETALEALSALHKYSTLIKKILSIQEVLIEPFIWEFVHFSDLLEKSSFIARRNFIGPPYLLWYIFRTEWEAQTLKLLIIGKKEGVSSEILRKILGIASYLAKYEDSH